MDDKGKGENITIMDDDRWRGYKVNPQSLRVGIILEESILVSERKKKEKEIEIERAMAHL